MKLVWHIVKKDLRHVWPAIVCWLAFVALRLPFAFYSYFQIGEQGPWVSTLNTCGMLADSLFVIGLIAWLVHDDAVPGHSAFWVTRPISGGRLLAAKFFVVFLICLVGPMLVLISEWCCLGFGWGELPSAGTIEVIVSAILILIALSFAVVTARAESFWLALIVAFVASLAGAIVGKQRFSLILNITSLSWLWLLAFIVGIVYQFMTRRSKVTLAVFSVGVGMLIVQYRFDLHLRSERQPLSEVPDLRTAKIGLEAEQLRWREAKPDEGYPALLEGIITIDLPKEYCKVTLRLMDGKWIGPNGETHTAVLLPSGWGTVVAVHRSGETADERRQEVESCQKDPYACYAQSVTRGVNISPPAYLCKVPVVFDGSWLTETKKTSNNFAFSGKFEITFTKETSASYLKLLPGATAQYGPNWTRVVKVTYVRKEPAITSVEFVVATARAWDLSSNEMGDLQVVDANGYVLSDLGSTTSRGDFSMLGFRLARLTTIQTVETKARVYAIPAAQIKTATSESSSSTSEPKSPADLGWRLVQYVTRVVGANQYSVVFENPKIIKDNEVAQKP